MIENLLSVTRKAGPTLLPFWSFWSLCAMTLRSNLFFPEPADFSLTCWCLRASRSGVGATVRGLKTPSPGRTAHNNTWSYSTTCVSEWTHGIERTAVLLRCFTSDTVRDERVVQEVRP